MDIRTVQRLRREASALVSNAADADDLVQDTLLAALHAGRDDAPWLAGVMRNQAALAVRSAVRRRKRETAEAMPAETTPVTDERTADHASATELLNRLPPAARRVAVLALHGLAADDIRWILDITPAAFRQRLTSIRKSLVDLAPGHRALALACAREPARSVDLQFGLVRRALQAALASRPAGLATHDVDGHLMVIHGRAHTRAPCGNG